MKPHVYEREPLDPPPSPWITLALAGLVLGVALGLAAYAARGVLWS